MVVEILSPTTTLIDRSTKLQLYARHAVPYYWIVDPELEMVKVYRPAEGGFTRVAELSAESGDTLTTPLLPGLVISIKEVFE